MFESAIVSKDVVNIADADVQFHDTIYAMTDNDRLIQIINKLKGSRCTDTDLSMLRMQEHIQFL